MWRAWVRRKALSVSFAPACRHHRCRVATQHAPRPGRPTRAPPRPACLPADYVSKDDPQTRIGAVLGLGISYAGRCGGRALPGRSLFSPCSHATSLPTAPPTLANTHSHAHATTAPHLAARREKEEVAELLLPLIMDTDISMEVRVGAYVCVCERRERERERESAYVCLCAVSKSLGGCPAGRHRTPTLAFPPPAPARPGPPNATMVCRCPA